MWSRVLVLGPPEALDAVRRALPDTTVAPAPQDLEVKVLREADCLVIAPGAADDAWQRAIGETPIIRLIPGGDGESWLSQFGDIPSATLGNSAELRLALRAAVVEHRGRELLGELTGTWAHDIRGALGVTRLALELLKAGGDTSSPIQKMDNGLTRLGFLIERLPSQIALGFDLPLTDRTSASVFPTLAAYVAHLQLVHARRPIELGTEGDWASSLDSQALVPFAAGFAELAFKVSPARAKMRFSTGETKNGRRSLEVACECPTRPEPWNVQRTLGAFELSRHHDESSPYRLVEAARLALRFEMPLQIAFTDQGFLASVTVSGQESGSPSVAPR